MALNPTAVGDNAFGPSALAETYLPDQLIAGNLKLVTQAQATITGAAAYARGTVMGRASAGAATSAAKSGGNTGTGTCTVDGTTPVLGNAQEGIYQARCITAATNSGTFRVTDPKGDHVGDVVVGTAFTDQIKFVIADGGTDFAVGDGFDITVSLSAGKFKKAAKTATDGSQVPYAILVDDVDATSADQNGGLYLTGEFNANKLIYDNSYTLDDLSAAFRSLGIFIKSAVSAADPT
ncbi:MAG TPA: head decoration protein [Rhizomicrobium sp.]|jgi:hypothetical protein|nr:head decoration protein [Rhizomicrobium sp.]